MIQNFSFSDNLVLCMLVLRTYFLTLIVCSYTDEEIKSIAKYKTKKVKLS